MLKLTPQLKRSDLPKVAVKAGKEWVLLLVEPPRKQSDVLVTVASEFDENMDVGVGWVLTAGKEAPVKQGDCVLFRRWMRTHSKAQPEAALEEIAKKAPLEDCECFFLHWEDIFAVLQEESEEVDDD